jgi:hypothetical protein
MPRANQLTQGMAAKLSPDIKSKKMRDSTSLAQQAWLSW